ncbi:MAG: hypothetical protein AAF609_08555 [Cyanobacteria bacterium P01_C01_bin.120]
MVEISKAGLASRAIRRAIGEDGTRVLEIDFSFSNIQDARGLIERIGRGAISLVGGLTKFVGRLALGVFQRIPWQRVWSGLIATLTRVAVFDWNQTDEELSRLQEGNNLAMFAAWGSLIGSGAGWLTGIGIGYGIGMAMPVIGGASLARAISSATTLEAIEEVQATLRAAVTQTVESQANNAIIGIYRRYRTMFRSADKEQLSQLLGDNVATYITETWGTESAPSFTIAGKIEDTIDSIPWDWLRVLTENAVEEYLDSIIESGYVIANQLDTAFQQTRMQNADADAAAARAVTIYPEGTDSNVRLYLDGTETEVKEQVRNVIAQTRVLGARDLGEWVGQPIGDYLRAQPHRRKASVIFKDLPGRATRNTDGSRARFATYSIPDLEQIFTWEALKRAVRPYNWGEWRATANLTNGRQMAVYGGTGPEAEDKLKDLLTLSTADIATLSISQEKDRSFRLRKRITRMYPYRLKLLVRRFDPDGSSFVDQQGNPYTEQNFAIPLWPDEEPEEFRQTSFFGSDPVAN